MASVEIYMSNDLDQLADKVLVNRNDLFVTNHFVTQTAGINHWLSLKLAQKEGVMANFKFTTPNDLIMSVAQVFGNTNSSEYSAENIRWRIFKLLDSSIFNSKFKSVASYYKEDQLKRIQLATKLADLFDQYIIYRTDMMVEWQDKRYEEDNRES